MRNSFLLLVFFLFSFLSRLEATVLQSSDVIYGKTLETIEISGLRHTKREIVIRELASKIGEPYLKENAQRDHERLDRLGVFSSIRAQAVLQGEGVLLEIEVQETFPYLPILAIEVTEENGTTAGPGLKAVNLFGAGVAFSGAGKFGGQTVVEVRADSPEYANTLGYQTAFIRRNRFNEVYAFNEDSTEIEASVSRPWGESGRFGAGFRFLTLASDVEGNTLSPDGRDNIPAVGVFLGYDDRDRISIPRRGWWNEFLVSKHGIAGADGDFWSFVVDVRRYQLVAPRHTLAFFSLTTLRTGTVGQDVPVYLQLNLGGTNTIRGRSLAERGGKNEEIATVEYHYTVMEPRSWKILGFTGYLGIQLTGFGDLGSAWSNQEEFSSNLIGGYGFGVRLLVPFVNVLRMDVGFGEPGGGVRFHLGINEKAIMARRRVR